MKTYLTHELTSRLTMLSMGRSQLKPADQDAVRFKCELFKENLVTIREADLKAWILANYEWLLKCIQPTHRKKFIEKFQKMC